MQTSTTDDGPSSTAAPIAVPDVSSNDAHAMKAIARNRQAHQLSVPVDVFPPTALCRRVALVLDNTTGIMAAHQPLARTAWEAASKMGVLSRKPGQLSTFGAAISSNERPERITTPSAFLRSAGIAERCTALRGRFATRHELLRAHAVEHVDKMLQFASAEEGDEPCCPPCDESAILAVASTFNTVFMNEHSVNAALYAAGSTIEATRAVLSTDDATEAAVCVVRPPGHHSGAQRCRTRPSALCVRRLTRHHLRNRTAHVCHRVRLRHGLWAVQQRGDGGSGCGDRWQESAHRGLGYPPWQWHAADL